MALATLRRELERLRAQVAQQKALDCPPPGSPRGPGDYPDDPVGYCKAVLGKMPTAEQEAIARALLTPPYRVLVKSGHATGKTMLAAWLVSWFFDSFRPGLCYSTAPKFEHVKDVLWKEVRRLRREARLPDHFIGPSAPEMRTSAEHFAKGVTASKGGAFQGQHDAWMLFVFDECIDVDPIYWEATKTMHKGDGRQLWLAIGNPTDTSTAAYQEDSLADLDGTPTWHRFRLSSLDHPNIREQLRGAAPPIPNAVTVSQVNQWVAEWCEPVAAADRVATDVEWPPGTGRWHKPSPLFQARVLGLWPDAGCGVWSDSLWAACLKGPAPAFPLSQLPQLGCDCATGKGEDYMAIHGRWGAVSVLHETSNTMDPARIFARLKEAAAEMADLVDRRRPAGSRPTRPQEVSIKIDDDGVGSAITAFLRQAGYQVTPVGAGTSADDPERYPRKRDELWFAAAAKARAGGVYLDPERIDRASLRRLKQQLLAPAWRLDAEGRRRVEPKEETKRKLSRSPDEADAFNLSHYEPPSGGAEVHAGGGRGDWRPGNLAQPEPPRQVAFGAAGEAREDYRRRAGGHFGYR